MINSISDLIEFMCEKDYYVADSHVHLSCIHRKNQINLPDYIAYCLKNRVNKHLAVTVDLADYDYLSANLDNEIVNYENIVVKALGIHPLSIGNSKFSHIDLDNFQQFISTHNKKVIGEIGCDVNYATIDLQQQFDVFIFLLKIVVEQRGFASIHAVGCLEQIINILADHCFNNKCKGIIHSFNGTLEQAKKIIALNDFYLGVGPSIINHKKLQQVIKQCPIEYLVLETDAPYMCEIDLNKNHPLLEVLYFLYELYDKDLSILEQLISTSNKVFKIIDSSN